MNIYNLGRAELIMLDQLWQLDSEEMVQEFLFSLTPEDQIRCRWLVSLLIAGGDDVDNVDQAAAELKRISTLI